MKKNKKKTVLITNCAQGVGYCVAHGLRARDWQVFTSASQKEDVERLRKERFRSLYLNPEDSDSIKRIVSEILCETEGTLDALFNNGFSPTHPISKGRGDHAVIQKYFKVNVFAAQELLNIALRVMLKQGYGRILQNSSVPIFFNPFYRNTYALTKYAIEGIMNTLRFKFRDQNILFSLIETGPMLNRFNQSDYRAFFKYVNGKSGSNGESENWSKKNLVTSGDGLPPFSLTPEEIFDAVTHALESKTPKVRYRVKYSAKVYWWMKALWQNLRPEPSFYRSG